MYVYMDDLAKSRGCKNVLVSIFTTKLITWKSLVGVEGGLILMEGVLLTTLTVTGCTSKPAVF